MNTDYKQFLSEPKLPLKRLRIELVKESKCDICSSTEFIQNDYQKICEMCGNTTNELTVVHDTTGVYPTNVFVYVRSSHFKNAVKRLLGEERITFSDEHLELFRKEIVKYRLQPRNITREFLKNTCKKLKFPKMYNHVGNLLRIFNPGGLPVISEENREKMDYIFDTLQEPYELLIPDKRRNFLNYSFVLYKICQLLELDSIQYESHFIRMKLHSSLILHERTWNKMIRYIVSLDLHDDINWNKGLYHVPA